VKLLFQSLEPYGVEHDLLDCLAVILKNEGAWGLSDKQKLNASRAYLTPRTCPCRGNESVHQSVVADGRASQVVCSWQGYLKD
jgi:hypothetical protein